MASGPFLGQSPCQNPLLINTGDNELANVSFKDPIESSSFLASNSHILILEPTLNVVLAFATAFIPTLAPAIPSTNINLFKEFMKAYIKAQRHYLALAFPLILTLIRILGAASQSLIFQVVF